MCPGAGTWQHGSVGAPSGIAVFASTQLELFTSVALVRALGERRTPVCLLVAGEPEDYSRDLAIYRRDSWSGGLAGVRVRQIPNCRAEVLERLLSEENPSSVILPGAVENPAGLAPLCAAAAGRAGAPTAAISARDISRLMLRHLSAALEEAASRGPAAPGLELAGDYILSVFSKHGMYTGPTARRRLVSILKRVEAAHDLRVLWPAAQSIPLDILDCLRIASAARMILTDRADIQILACLLGVPCVSLLERSNVPETVAIGANLLAGSDEEEIQRAVGIMARKLSRWEDPWASAALD